MKKNTFKMIVSLLLAVVLTTGLLAGCASTPAQTEAPAAETPAQTETPAAEAPAEETPAAEEEAPAESAEPATLLE